MYRRLESREILNKDDDQNNVFMASDTDRNIFDNPEEIMSDAPFKTIPYEETKSQNVLGRPSFSDNPTGQKRGNFCSPEACKRTSRSRLDEQEKPEVSGFEKHGD